MSTFWNWLSAPVPSRRPVGLRLVQLEGREVPSTVTSTMDEDDYMTTTDWAKDHPQEYKGPDGDMSIREAIREVNKKGGSLTFEVDSITLTKGALDPIVKRVTVTGKDAGGKPGTTIDGGGAAEGITLSGGGSVKNLVIQGFGGYGLLVLKATTIENNYIGTDAAGMTAKPNGRDGIDIDGGGSTVKNNVISGNSGDGITITGSGNKVTGNKIGLGVDGTTPLGNSNGIVLGSGARGNTIGGTAAADRNLIAANSANGIWIQLSNSNKVLGNSIGVDKTGTVRAGNLQDGILIEGSSGTTVGGTSKEARNIIAANLRSGVRITNFNGFGNVPASNNTVMGNFIGLGNDESIKGNGQFGVSVSGGARNNTIGGTRPGAGNVISGNDGAGVAMNVTGTTGNRVYGNKIGTDAAGNAPKANGVDGVFLAFGASGNLIGGAGAAGNVISGNTTNGANRGSTWIGRCTRCSKE